MIAPLIAAVYCYTAADRASQHSPSLISRSSTSSDHQPPLIKAEPSAPSTTYSAKPPAPGQDFEKAFEDWLVQIQLSNSAVDQTARAIYEKDPAKNIVTLKSLLEADPQNPLLHYLLAQNCRRKFEPSLCKPVHQSALAIYAADNAVVQDLAFLDAYQQANQEKALAALGEANHASYTDNFDGAAIEVLAESMKAANIRPDLHMVEAIQGILAAQVDTIYSDLIKACQQHGQNDWQNACYLRGMALAERGTGGYTKMVGLQLIKNTGRTNDPGYEQLYRQQQNNIAAANSGLALMERAKAAGFQPNDVEWKEFLLRYQTQGEDSAKTYLLDVARQRGY